MTRHALIPGIVLLMTGLASADPPKPVVPRVRLGFQGAYGIERPNTFGSGPSNGTRVAMFQPSVAVALVRSGERPIVEWLNEATLARSLQPSRHFIMSINEGFRFHIGPTRKVGTYLELGAGVGQSGLHTDPDAPRHREDRLPGEFDKLDGWLQFHLQVGGGLRIKAGRGAVQLGYRMTHFSNNGTQLPNLGLNLHTVVVSYQTRPF